MNQDVKSTFMIRGGRYRTGETSVLNAVGNIDSSERGYLEYNPSNIIYYDSITGNDTTGTGTSGNPYKTYSKCVSVWTSGRTIQSQENDVIEGDITRPLQSLIGKNVTVSASGFSDISGNYHVATGNSKLGIGINKDTNSIAVFDGSWSDISTVTDDTINIIEYTYSNGVYYIMYRDVNDQYYYMKYDGSVLENGVINFPRTLSTSIGVTFAGESGGDLRGIIIDGQSQKVYLGTLSNNSSATYLNDLGSYVYKSYNYNGRTWVGRYEESPYQIKIFELVGNDFIEKITVPITSDASASFDFACNDDQFAMRTLSGIAAQQFSGTFSTSTVTEVTTRPSEFLTAYNVVENEGIFYLTYTYLFAAGNGRLARFDGAELVQISINATNWNAASSTVPYVSVLDGYLYVNSRNTISIIQDALTVSADSAGISYLTPVDISGSIEMINNFVYSINSGFPSALLSCKTGDLSGATTESRISDNLIIGNTVLDCTGIANNQDVRISNNTVIGNIEITTASALQAGRIYIADNIHEGNITSNYAGLVIQSGNQRGTRTNTVYNYISSSNPEFKGDGTYRLKRNLEGDDIDSPVIKASLFSVTPSGQKRDLGAWNIQEPALAYDYRRTFYATRPDGGYRIIKQNAAKALPGLNGEFDVSNLVNRATVEILVSYTNGVNQDHVDFQDYLESLNDTTVEIDLWPEVSLSSSVTLSAGASIGAVSLSINLAVIPPGARFTIGDIEYYILYSTPNQAAATEIVLSRPLESALLSAAVLTLNSPALPKTYKYVPSAQREVLTPAFEAPATDAVRGNVSWRFVGRWS